MDGDQNFLKRVKTIGITTSVKKMKAWKGDK